MVIFISAKHFIIRSYLSIRQLGFPKSAVRTTYLQITYASLSYVAEKIEVTFTLTVLTAVNPPVYHQLHLLKRTTYENVVRG
jgi:hypothetical protein